MADYTFTEFPIDADEIDIDQLQQDVQNVTDDILAINQAIDSINQRITALTQRTINGLDLSEDRVLKSAQFSEAITGEKMLANLLYSSVSSWDSGTKKSIKLESDTYLDSSGIATDSTGFTLNDKISGLYVKAVGTSSGNTHLTVKRGSGLPANTEVQFFLFASGSGGTTLCGIGYVRESSEIAYFTSLGSKSITCTYDGDGGALLTVGTYCTGLILANRKFVVSASA